MYTPPSKFDTITTKSGARAVHNPYPSIMNSSLYRGYVEFYKNGSDMPYMTKKCAKTHSTYEAAANDAAHLEYELSGTF